MYRVCRGEGPCRRLRCDGFQGAGLGNPAVVVVDSAGIVVEAGPVRVHVGYRLTRRF